MTEEKNIVPEEQHFGGKRDLKRLFRQSKKSQFSFSSCLFYPHFGVRFLLKGFPLFMSSLFNPETVSSLLCCYRYTALLRVQVLPSGAPFSLSCFWIVKKKTFCVFFSWEVVLFSVKVRLSSPDVPCSCSHLVFVSFSLCLSRSSESLRHSSVSPLSGGEQGRDPIPGTQLDWVVWEVWVVLLAPLLLTVFFFSLRFSLQLISSCHYRVCSNRENYFFFVSSLTHLFPFSCSSIEWHASAWFSQPTHGMWVWVRVIVPVLTGRGCLASYSNLNVLMV